MRLKKLILHGFKSFADRTEFVFDAPITGIVGPNGCGKSNVVDGFKWVLGEQSAKSLRGDAMMDVIFNGASSRKPAGMAEVTLVFENPPLPDGTRAISLSTDEVSVGRRLFRDGTSEYQINNATARLEGRSRIIPRHRHWRRCVQRHRAGTGGGAAGGQPRRAPPDFRRGRRHFEIQGSQEGIAAQAGEGRSEPSARERHRRGSGEAAAQREDSGHQGAHLPGAFHPPGRFAAGIQPAGISHAQPVAARA